MNDPQQIRRALTEIRRSLDSFPREGLAEILALVFKEYVVEGSQPLASGGQVIDARSDLEGMSFPELVVWLQTHLDLPELALFEVAGADVSVRADGKLSRLIARPAPPVAVTPQLVAMPLPATPRPVASTSIPAQPVVAAPATPPAAPAPKEPAKEEPTGETGTRFSLLEVD